MGETAKEKIQRQKEKGSRRKRLAKICIYLWQSNFLNTFVTRVSKILLASVYLRQVFSLLLEESFSKENKKQMSGSLHQRTCLCWRVTLVSTSILSQSTVKLNRSIPSPPQGKRLGFPTALVVNIKNTQLSMFVVVKKLFTWKDQPAHCKLIYSLCH